MSDDLRTQAGRALATRLDEALLGSVDNSIWAEIAAIEAEALAGSEAMSDERIEALRTLASLVNRDIEGQFEVVFGKSLDDVLGDLPNYEGPGTRSAALHEAWVRNGGDQYFGPLFWDAMVERFSEVAAFVEGAAALRPTPEAE